MFKRYREEAEFALEAVRRAAALSMQIRSDTGSPSLTKADHSPVTVADFASQALLGQMLEEHFPSERLVAEEDSRMLRADGGETLTMILGYLQPHIPQTNPEAICRWIDHGTQDPDVRFWTYDPIDGTKGFIRGGQYVSALALIEDGIVVVAALGCPNLNQDVRPEVNAEGVAIVAVRGEGCYRFGMAGEDSWALKVSDLDQSQPARLLRSYESDHTDEQKMAELIRILALSEAPVHMDSQAKYALIAAGGSELLFRLVPPTRPEHVESIWDHAAGSLVVEEAGGRVSDLRGEVLDFSQGRTLQANTGVLASNGHLHEAALAALKRVGADQRSSDR